MNELKAFDAPLDAPRDFGSQILVLDDHARARESMAAVLSSAGHEVTCCSSAAEALAILENRYFDVILTDLKMPGMDGLEFMRRLGQRNLDSQVVMVTAHATVATAVQAMRYGAFDYIEKPFNADDLEQLVERALRHGEMVGRRSMMPDEITAAQMVMVGQSAGLQTVRRKIAQTAPTDETVLITGESGVGKELVAHALHAASRRSEGPFVSLNCPTLAPQLMESELFGHERGAFTSADAPRIGRFELADGGTILLDEISEIGLPLQAKLLRVLQEKTFERVGSNETRSANVRVIATTNRDLRNEAAKGRFREDLFFRLAVVPLAIPPLRERAEDVPLLADHFLEQAARRLQRGRRTLSRSACELLVQYDWPGNVRELENLITRACVLGDEGEISAEEVRPWLADNFLAESALAETDRAGQEPLAAGMSLQEMERKLIEATLARFNGHRQKTARALGIGVRTLCNKLRSYGYAPRAKDFGEAA